MKSLIALTFPLIASLSFTSAASAALTPAAVDASVEKATNWILSQQHNGNWEQVAVAGHKGDNSVDDGQWGGLTALATLALLDAGVSRTDPHILQAVKFLENADVHGNYALSLRARVWPYLKRRAEIRQFARADLVRLLNGMHSEGHARGLYYYYWDQNTGPKFDHSVSGYVANGVAALAGMNLEVPEKFWLLTDTAWRNHQFADGAWAYYEQGDESMTMTTTGLNVLYLTQDALRANLGVDCSPVPEDPNIDKANTWITANFKHIFDVPDIPAFFLQHYTLYNLQRIAAIAGVKYFDRNDWYAVGADKVVSRQKPDGSWDNLPDTCFSLLFLASGRAPVMMEKLQYTKDGDTNATVWNQRKRDVANAVQWTGEAMEARLNWQIVDWDVSAQDLHDAPILYISGNKALKFSLDQRTKLKQFMDEGGLIFANADCDAEYFSTSVRQLAKFLYPDYTFRPLPEKHPIYNDEQFPRRMWHHRPTVFGLSNGVRELMLLVCDSDPGRAYQMRQVEQHTDAFQLAADVYQYMGGRDHPRNKGDRFTVLPDPAKRAARIIKLARIQFNGNWNPEPAGWTRLAAILHNEQSTDLQVTALPLGMGKLDKSYKIAALTGTGTFQLLAPARTELQSFVGQGGTLLIDAGGGDTLFAASAEAEVRAIFPGNALQSIPLDDPLFSGKPDIHRVTFTHSAQSSIVGRADAAVLKGIQFRSRWGVVYSPLDISAGLVGNDVDGVVGYSSESATALTEHLVLAAPSAASAEGESQR